MADGENSGGNWWQDLAKLYLGYESSRSAKRYNERSEDGAQRMMDLWERGQRRDPYMAETLNPILNMVLGQATREFGSDAGMQLPEGFLESLLGGGGFSPAGGGGQQRDGSRLPMGGMSGGGFQSGPMSTSQGAPGVMPASGAFRGQGLMQTRPFDAEGRPGGFGESAHVPVGGLGDGTGLWGGNTNSTDGGLQRPNFVRPSGPIFSENFEGNPGAGAGAPAAGGQDGFVRDMYERFSQWLDGNMGKAGGLLGTVFGLPAGGAAAGAGVDRLFNYDPNNQNNFGWMAGQNPGDG